MFILLCTCTFIKISSAVSIHQDAQASIEFYENTNDGSGNSKFSFRTSNGIVRSETSELLNAGQPDEQIVVRGEYSYTGPDGNLVEVHYVADENGFQIVQPQPMPLAIGSGVPPNVVATLLG